jgi:hypothetical protein
LLLLVLVVGVLAGGCSGKPEPVTIITDTDGTQGEHDQGFLRGIWWTGPGYPDEEIDDVVDVNEQNVDITNVVYDNAWPQGMPIMPGHIKNTGGPPGDYYTYTVAAWQEPVYIGETIDEWDSYFRVLYRYESDPDQDGQGAIIEIDPDNSHHQSFPAITANYNGDGLIVVDVVYRRRIKDDPDDNWEIWHQRFIQVQPMNFDNFVSVGPPQPVSDPAWLDNCDHPDIVFDADPDFPGGNGTNRLHVVYEKAVEYYDREIWYRRGEEVNGAIIWTDVNQVISGLTYGLNGRASIDVGRDDTGYIQMIMGPTPTNYYVGVVWEHGDYMFGGEDHDWQFDIFFAPLPASGPVPPLVNVAAITDSPFRHFNVFPEIDIDPLENPFKCTFIVWTHAINSAVHPPDRDWRTVYLEGNNSWRLVNWLPPVELFNTEGPGGRNGLPSFAIRADQSAHGWGFLVWLNDQYPIEFDVNVYAGGVFWEYNTPELSIYSYYYYGAPHESPKEISFGDSSWSYGKFTYGPEVAIFNVNWAKCIWTDVEEIGPEEWETGIWGDTSDHYYY